MRGRLATGVLVAAVIGCSSGPSGNGASPPVSTEPDSDGSTATTAPRTTTTRPPPRSFTLAATGDLLLHAPVVRAAQANAGGVGYDFGPMFAPVAPLLSAADLAVCHMETPMARDGAPISSYPVFSVPGALAPAVAAAGYDTCSTASNHALDKGADGVAATLEHLDAAGVRHAGTARNELEAAARAIYDVRGVAVGHLSYTYGFNGFSLPAGTPWLANLIDPGRILADAHGLRDAGAEVVVVSLHWGVEFVSDPTVEQEVLAPSLLASPDVDLVLGHHAHVVQPVERFGTEFVAYGLGNFLSNQSSACCPAASQDGMILHVTMTEQPGGGFTATEVSYTPTLVERGTYRIVPVPVALADPTAPPATRAALEASLVRTSAVVESRGGAAAGIVRRRP